MTGEELFGHMIYFREMNSSGTDGSKYTTELSKRNAGINVEISDANVVVLKHTARLIAGDNIESKRSILKDAFGAGAKQRLAKRKLDSLGMVKAHCGLMNSKESLESYERLATMTASVAAIQANKTNDKELKQKAMKEELTGMIDDAVRNIVKHRGNLQKKAITKKQIASVLCVKHDVFNELTKTKRDASREGC